MERCSRLRVPGEKLTQIEATENELLLNVKENMFAVPQLNGELYIVLPSQAGTGNSSLHSLGS